MSGTVMPRTVADHVVGRSAAGVACRPLVPGRTLVFGRAFVTGIALRAFVARIEATGRVHGTRKATKRIVGEAERLGCDAIVMAADPPRSRLVADMMWSQEPYRVRRRARVPVYLVPRDR